MELKRPMLAAPTKPEELRAVKWPMLASVKLDGIRALCRRNPDTGAPELVSRRLIAIPNLHCQYLFAREEYVGFDGELMVGEWNDKQVYNRTNSAVMTVDGEPDVRWAVFDMLSDEPYYARARKAKDRIGMLREATEDCRVAWLPQVVVHGFHEMEGCEQKALNEGYEGLMLRHPKGPYKQNRSTVKQAYLLKVKRFADGEAEILSCQEQMQNNNEATKDERGYTKRSSHAENKSETGMLGAVTVRDLQTGVEFDCGTGFTHEQRRNLWEGRKYLIGKVIKYRHFPIGVKDKPRFPTFVGFRDKRDMG